MNCLYPHEFVITSKTCGRVFYKVPCGRCEPCKIMKRTQWTVRLRDEQKLHEKSCVLTLTYDNKHLQTPEIITEDVQKMFKRMRKAGLKFRYFAAGEYGQLTNRPHWHIIFYGIEFGGLYKLSNGKISSEEFKNWWPYGFNTYDSLSDESIAYTAGYTTKKSWTQPKFLYSKGLGVEYALQNSDHVRNRKQKGKKIILPKAYKSKMKFQRRELMEPMRKAALKELEMELEATKRGMTWYELESELRSEKIREIYLRHQIKKDGNL